MDGRNQTFLPSADSQSQSLTRVPVGKWNLASPTDNPAHMLQVKYKVMSIELQNNFLFILSQGVRVSTEFLNSLMWYASVSNVTTYKGYAQVLDSQVLKLNFKFESCVLSHV